MLRIWSVMERNRTDEDPSLKFGEQEERLRAQLKSLSAAEGWIPGIPTPSTLLGVRVMSATDEGKNEIRDLQQGWVAMDSV